MPANAWNTGWRPSAGASARAAGFAPSTVAMRSVEPAPSTSPTTSPSTSGPAAMKQAAAVLRVGRQQFAAVTLEPARREQQHRGVRRQPILGPRRPAARRRRPPPETRRRPACPPPARAARRTRRGSTSPEPVTTQHRRLAGAAEHGVADVVRLDAVGDRRRVTAADAPRGAPANVASADWFAPSDTVASPAGRSSIRQMHARVARPRRRRCARSRRRDRPAAAPR